MFKEDSARTVPDDPAIVFAEAVVFNDNVVFIEDAEAIDAVVENANPTDAASDVEEQDDPETQNMIPIEVGDEASSVDTPVQGDSDHLFLCCCDYRVAVVGINAAFLTILILVDFLPPALDQILMPIAMALIICGIYGAIFFKRWAVNTAAFYYALHTIIVIIENVIDHKPYRALVRICIFSGILYAHVNMSKQMMEGIMTPQNYPNIACPRTWC